MKGPVKTAILGAFLLASESALAQSDNNDLFFLNGDLQDIDEIVTSPSGFARRIQGEFFVSSSFYNGFGGDDTLIMTSFADYLPSGSLTSIEAVIASNGSDFVDVSGQDVAITVFGGAGDDTIFGGMQSDTIFGSSGADFIDGGKGNDRLDGQTGDDTLVGGRGDDFLIGGPGDVTYFGGSGSDLLFGGSGAAIMSGGSEQDLFFLSAADFASGQPQMVITDLEFGDFFSLLFGEVTNNTVSDLVRFEQSGDDTLVMVADASADSALTFYQFGVLQNVDASRIAYVSNGEWAGIDALGLDPSAGSNLDLYGAFTLAPIPLPGTLLLLLSGMGFLRGLRRFDMTLNRGT